MKRSYIPPKWAGVPQHAVKLAKKGDEAAKLLVYVYIFAAFLPFQGL